MPTKTSAVAALKRGSGLCSEETDSVAHGQMAPAVWPGPFSGTSFAPATGGARPDQRVAFAVLVVEEVGVDGGVEAGIVQFEAEVFAALVGALGPGGADLGATDHHAVAGGVLAGSAQVGDDAHALGLDAEGDDVAGELVRAGLLEGADGCHVKISIFRFEPAPCGLDGDRPAGGDRRRIASGSPSRLRVGVRIATEAKRRTAQARFSCFARNG